MEEKGVWRTVGGRRIFIKEGQSLTEAMKNSGKFGDKEEYKEKSIKRWEELKQKYSDAEIQKGKYESIVRYNATPEEDDGKGKFNDTTQEELNAMPSKFITYKPNRTEYIYKNKNELINDIQKSYGGFKQFGEQYTIASASGIGEYYLYRAEYSKGGWEWKDVNDDTVTGRESRKIGK